MKTEIWQDAKQAITILGAKTRRVWKISFQGKKATAPFYQFTEDFRLSESPYIIHFTRFTNNPLEFLYYSKGLFE
ncbi:hypothetical protein [Chitinophaga sp. GbtcB8]|uniref:hypothetical protein n=1 Tax=Chitinophaga sp. GbtcB8 TaxID=2824753 RepID=UPI001C2F5821|nr:hypothetical protein [Chitinophaga sp. GbtcB8]